TACPFCGVQFEGSTGAGLAAELDDFLREDVPTRICQACGATMDKDATACIVCDRQYSPAELALLPTLAPILDESGPFCSRCGAYLFSDEPECAICGTSVTATPEVATGGKGVVKDFLSRWQRMAPPSATTSEADRLAEELEHYDRLLEANPSLERAWANRAKVLDKLGRTKEAAESLAKAAELNPAREDRYRLEVQNILRSTLERASDSGTNRSRSHERPGERHPERTDERAHERPGQRAGRGSRKWTDNWRRKRPHVRSRRHERPGQWKRIYKRTTGSARDPSDPTPAPLVPLRDRDRGGRSAHDHRADPREHSLAGTERPVLDHPHRWRLQRLGE